jgi:hypothetical protein
MSEIRARGPSSQMRTPIQIHEPILENCQGSIWSIILIERACFSKTHFRRAERWKWFTMEKTEKNVLIYCESCVQNYRTRVLYERKYSVRPLFWWS